MDLRAREEQWQRDDPFAAEIAEECGVFGIYAPGEDVARITFFGLYALQHRGQESAGIAAADGVRVSHYAEMGLVAQVFSEADLAHLRGHIAVGHTRYSTTGSSRLYNAQPIVVESDLGPLALAHNGNLVNAAELQDELSERGSWPRSSTDSEVVARLCATAPGSTWLERIHNTAPMLRGAFALVMLSRDRLFALRDPWGIRPLSLGRLGTSGWVVASESCALDTVGASFIRDVEPGELLMIDEDGVHSQRLPAVSKCALCTFEYIYFARPDSVIHNRLVYVARERMGRALAREHPADADIVIAVPDSAIPAAQGFANESGLPLQDGLVKNRYIGRTFIQPDQRLREAGVRLKFNPLPEVLQGKRVVVVDDSIVRGTTTPPVITLLRRAGAREVHLRICAPPMKFPCFLGVDTARRSELIAAQHDVPEICARVGADSLGYLSLDGLMWAIDLPRELFCNACFTGEYPMPVESEADKLALERS